MTLQKITQFACLAQLLALLAGVYTYLDNFKHLHWRENTSFFILEPIWLLAHGALVLFLFALATELKRNQETP